MRVRTMIATGATLGATLIVGPLAGTASAAVTATSSGTTVNVSAAGEVSVSFDCNGGNIRISGTFASPTVPCATVSHVNVLGDSGSQTVHGEQLDDPVFAAHPYLVALTGTGADYVYGTARADTLNTGAGNDVAYVTTSGVTDASVDLGADSDQLTVDGGSGDDTITASASGSTVTLALNNGTTAVARTALNAETLSLQGNSGNDTISVAGVPPGTSVTTQRLIGGTGDDHLIGGPTYAYFYGGSGTNVMTGSTGIETFTSESETDDIHPGTGSTNSVYDQTSLHLGRTIANEGTSDQWFGTTGTGRDAVIRYRPLGSSQSQITASLDRPGQQQLGSAFTRMTADSGYSTTLDARHLFDVVAPQIGTTVVVTGDNPDNDLADITVPTGTWSWSGTSDTTAEITPTSSTLGHITIKDMGDVSIHGPWTGNLNAGFVHRATRDLLFRFPNPIGRDQIADQLTAGTTTRAAFITGAMNTDEYRGLDVDRVFVKYLHRASDPGGRTYWINSIAAGKPLWKFRAQLFGSNEYFTKAGGTNALYMVKAYADVLGRAPDPSGQAYWTAKLDAGADRGSVALQFIDSAEARRRLVDDQFLRFLDRKPTTGEQTTWVNALPGDTGEQDLIAFLAGSTGYYNRS
ncbi:DUF4214 domain-containing protein [Aquihabitans sp. McL0605]|uniref:DUF4214 domain-containing protein n=1 Tax=Aquihabitans sp. McL0605 TaxID=3415671 RepID=UPI003CF02BA9